VYSSTVDRTSKPFNPLLCETYEYISKKHECRILTEQVSHHPPVSAFHAEAKDWTYWGYDCVDSKFWGRSMEIYPRGTGTLVIHKFQDEYAWNRVTTVVNNVLVGTKWIDHYGEMKVVNKKTGDKVVLDFKKKGLFYGSGCKVEGLAFDSSGKPQYKLEGKWNEKLEVTPLDSAEKEKPGENWVIWQKYDMPPNYEKYYYFTKFAMSLNELPDWQKEYLPITDSRFRPDQKALENGDLDLAAKEKSRLEEAQRIRRSEKTDEPLWFQKNAEGDWNYNGNYWTSRESKQWVGITDIYGLSEKGGFSNTADTTSEKSKDKKK